MALSGNRPSAAAWSELIEPGADVRHNTQFRCAATKLSPCGVIWDAVVVAPLERALAALDVLGLPTDGHPVLADYTKQELAVLIPQGSGGALAGLPGTRVLTRGAWLLTPGGRRNCEAATWLSRGEQYVDARALGEALLATDARRAAQSQAGFRAAMGTTKAQQGTCGDTL